MKTQVYVKMDARDQLLLSEGVCRQLGIISYHPEVQVWRGGRRPQQVKALPTDTPKQKASEARVPIVRVKLLQPVRIPSQHAIQADVLLESWPESCLEESVGVLLEEAVLRPDPKGRCRLVLSNTTGLSQVLSQGTELGSACPVEVVEPAAEGQVYNVPTWLPRTSSDEPTVSPCLEPEPPSGAREERLLNMLHVERIPRSHRKKLKS